MPGLGALLAGWDGKLTVRTGKLTAQHIDRCPVCSSRRHGSLRPEVLARLLPLPALPAGLREPVLEQAATRSVSRGSKAALAETSIDLLAPVGSGGLRGIFSWDRIRANPGTVTAATAMTLWVVAALAATLVAVTGLHATGVLADQAHSTAAASSSPAAGRRRPRYRPLRRHLRRIPTPRRRRPSRRGCTRRHPPRHPRPSPRRRTRARRHPPPSSRPWRIAPTPR